MKISKCPLHFTSSSSHLGKYTPLGMCWGWSEYSLECITWYRAKFGCKCSFFSYESIYLIHSLKKFWWMWLFCWHFRYKVDHITAESKYRFSLNVSVCLETSDECYLNFPVMTDVDIPILDCDFNNVSYAIKGLHDYRPIAYFQLCMYKCTFNVDTNIINCC